MKKLSIIFSLFLFGLLTGAAIGQQDTTVSVTVQDPTGQLWTNGTISYIFQPVANFNGQYYWGDNPLPDIYRTLITVQLDSSASASFTLPRSSDITPAGSGWSYKVCAQATTPCITVPIPTSGSTQDISPIINGDLNPISAPITTIPIAYQDSEIKTVISLGGIYYNSTEKVPKYWDGTEFQTFSSGGTFLLNPTGNQTVTQPSGTGIDFISSNCLTCWNFNANINQLTDTGGAITQNFGFNLNYTADGFGSNNANPNGINCNLNDCGWNVQHPFNLVLNTYKIGISGGINMNCNKFSAGDLDCLYIYPICVGGNTDASGEGCTLFKLNGTQISNFYSGGVTSTSGTGDTHPVLASGSMFTGGYLVDTKTATATGNFGGTQSTWSDGVSSTYLTQVNVTNTVVPSTGFCKSTTYLQGTDYTTEIPSTHSVTCTIVNSKPIQNSSSAGLVWQTGVLPERVVITNVAISGSTETFDVTGRLPAAIGTYFIQGGTQGAIEYVADNSATGIFTTYYCFGSPDSSHILATTLILGQIQGTPFASGVVAETLNSAYNIWPTARVLALDSTGQNPVLEANDIPFQAGDPIYVPPNVAYVEDGITFNSTQKATGNRNFASSGVVVNLGGQGNAYVAGEYFPFWLQVETNRAFYNCNSCGGSGWLDAPNAFTINSFNGPATIGNILVFDQPVSQGSGITNSGCALGSILCNSMSDHTQAFNLYAEGNNNQRIQINSPDGLVDFQNLHLKTDTINLIGAGSNGIVFPSLVDGTYIRCSTTHCVPNAILGADLPLASTTVVGAVKPDNTSITVNPSTGVISATSYTPPSGFTGSCGPAMTSTVVNGVVTGCS